MLRLSLQHDVEVARPRRVPEEVFEADRVDEVRVGAQLRQNDPAPLAALALFDVQPGRRVVDLRDDPGRPCVERLGQSLVVREAGRVEAAMMEDVPHHGNGAAAPDSQHVHECERPVVVLHREPRSGALGETLKALDEAVRRGGRSASRAADVQNDDRVWRLAHGIKQAACTRVRRSPRIARTGPRRSARCTGPGASRL